MVMLIQIMMLDVHVSYGLGMHTFLSIVMLGRCSSWSTLLLIIWDTFSRRTLDKTIIFFVILLWEASTFRSRHIRGVELMQLVYCASNVCPSLSRRMTFIEEEWRNCEFLGLHMLTWTFFSFQLAFTLVMDIHRRPGVGKHCNRGWSFLG